MHTQQKVKRTASVGAAMAPNIPDMYLIYLGSKDDDGLCVGVLPTQQTIII